MITRHWNNYQPKTVLNDESSRICKYETIWWNVSYDLQKAEPSRLGFYNTSIYKDKFTGWLRIGGNPTGVFSFTLLHRLLFSTFLCWATKKFLSKDKFLSGLGKPNNSRVAGLLGVWEQNGVIAKLGKGKHSSYKLVDGYNEGNWPNATIQQKQTHSRQVLKYIDLRINLFEVKRRAMYIKNRSTESPDFSL